MRLLQLRAKLLRRFRDDDRAVAVVEFALILPLLLLLYLGSIEASSLFTVDRRVEVIASTVADLTARWNPGDKAFAKSDLKDYFTAAEGILTPYPTAELKQVVSFISVTAAKNAKVVWSCGYNGGAALAKDSVYLLNQEKPHFTNLVTVNGTKAGYLIISKVEYPYKPVLGLVFTEKVHLSNSAMFLPRFGAAIGAPTGGCPT